MKNWIKQPKEDMKPSASEGPALPGQKPVEITSISVLSVSHRDVIVLRCPPGLTADDAMNLKLQLKYSLEKFGITCAGTIVLTDGLSLDVMSPVQ